jgi:hypothetical protein
MDKPKRKNDEQRPVLWLLTIPWRLIYYIINGRIPTFENARQEEIFWRIKRQYRRKCFLMLHGIVYTLGIVFLVAFAAHELYLQQFTNLLPEWNAVLQTGVVMSLWAIGILLHFLFVRLSNAEDVALGEALEREYTLREREQSYAEHYERLSEPLDNLNFDLEDKPKRRHRVNQHSTSVS